MTPFHHCLRYNQPVSDESHLRPVPEAPRDSTQTDNALMGQSGQNYRLREPGKRGCANSRVALEAMWCRPMPCPLPLWAMAPRSSP
jgi:hypothetical protein